MTALRRNAQAASGPNTEAWWKQIVAGEVEARHPLYGDELKVKLKDGRLVLSGEVASRRDRDQLLREARERLGNGVHSYDVSRLRIRPHDEKPGLTSQTLLAAFTHRDTARVALEYFLEHTSSKPLHAEIIDRDADVDPNLPSELLDAARAQLDRGMTLIAVEVDETEAFRARALLEEDTTSTWTVASPPSVLANGRP